MTEIAEMISHLQDSFFRLICCLPISSFFNSEETLFGAELKGAQLR